MLKHVQPNTHTVEVHFSSLYESMIAFIISYHVKT